jgi:hypothetical protein
MSPEKKPKKRIIGYRASAHSNRSFRARRRRVGCNVIYSDKASGKSMAGRPQLAPRSKTLTAAKSL